MAKPKEMQVVLTLTLTDEDMKKIADLSPGEKPDAALVRTITESVKMLAQGGQIVPHQVVDRIRKALDTTDPAAIVLAVEKSADMVDGKPVAMWSPDPVYIKPLQELALKQSCTYQQIVQRFLDFVMRQGSVYNFRSPFTISLTEEDRQFIASLMKLPPGKDFTGTGLAEWLRDITAEPLDFITVTEAANAAV